MASKQWSGQRVKSSAASRHLRSAAERAAERAAEAKKRVRDAKAQLKTLRKLSKMAKKAAKLALKKAQQAARAAVPGRGGAARSDARTAEATGVRAVEGKPRRKRTTSKAIPRTTSKAPPRPTSKAPRRRPAEVARSVIRRMKDQSRSSARAPGCRDARTRIGAVLERFARGARKRELARGRGLSVPGSAPPALRRQGVPNRGAVTRYTNRIASTAMTWPSTQIPKARTFETARTSLNPMTCSTTLHIRSST